ncbi:MAG: ABC-type sugar transport system substrate-binding protein, partial [Verrucomicrobiales bacterium]
MSRTMKSLMALLAVLALVAAACGSDEPTESAETTAAPTTAAPTTDPPEDTEAPAPTDAPTTTEAIEVDVLVEQFDADGDGTVTIGVAAAGPRDDNGYYQSLVNFAEEFSAANNFAAPIVSDNIGPAEAAQALSDLAQQGVDILMVGASEIAEPLPDLT